MRLRAFVNPAGHDVAFADGHRALIDRNMLALGGTHPAPEAPFASCNGSWVADTDSVGSDYAEVKGTTQEKCCELCAADPRCAVCVWNSPAGRCVDRCA